MAIMSVREGLEFESQIESDCAPLNGPVLDLLKEGLDVHCLRNLTRGGLASALNEIASAARVQIDVDDRLIAVREDVRGACEILGLDPLYVANEGRFIVFAPAAAEGKALEILRRHEVSRSAARIGTVQAGSPGLVTIRSRIGSQRILDLLSGEQLPRIC